MRTGLGDERLALYYDGKLVAYSQAGSLVVAREGMSETAERVRDGW